MRRIALYGCVVLLIALSTWSVVVGISDAASQGEGTWQVELSLSQQDMKSFVESLDDTCDIDIEPQGVSNYIVAYRCDD